MVLQPEYFPYKKDERIYVYGKGVPCCPDCGKRMKVHGTYERKLRTLQHPEGIRHVLRVLDCKECSRSHREVPDFIVPHKSYSYGYMCAVAKEEIETMDDRAKKRIVDLFCTLIFCRYSCLDTFLQFCGTIKTDGFARKIVEIVKIANFSSLKKENSIGLHFPRKDKHAILSAIRRKGVGSYGTTKKFGGKISQYSVQYV